MWLADNAPGLMCLTFGALIVLGVPVAFALAATGIGWLAIGDILGVMDGSLFRLIPPRIFGVLSNEVLLAIPFFTFMGFVLERAGIADDMLQSLASLFGRVRGGLAIAVVLVGAVLAAATGVVAASVTAIGIISLPLMLKDGYSPTLAAGTIAASGTLAQLVPPSIVLIVLAEQLGVPVGDIYSAALGPSLVLVGLYVSFIVGVGIIRPAAAPVMTPPALGVSRLVGDALLSLLLPGALIAVVLGSVLAGVATPTESGALGAIGAVVLGVARRRFGPSTLRAGLDHTMQLSSAIIFVIIGSTIFALAFYAFSGQVWVAEIIDRLPGGSRTFLLLTAVVIFLLSFFLDFFEIAFVVVPLLLPAAEALHIDLVWFGVLIALVIQTAFLHPPFGIAVYVLRSIAGTLSAAVGANNLTSRQIYVGVLPFIAIQFILVVSLIAFVGPEVAPIPETAPLRLQLPVFELPLIP